MNPLGPDEILKIRSPRLPSNNSPHLVYEENIIYDLSPKLIFLSNCCYSLKALFFIGFLIYVNGWKLCSLWCPPVWSQVWRRLLPDAAYCIKCLTWLKLMPLNLNVPTWRISKIYFLQDTFLELVWWMAETFPFWHEIRISVSDICWPVPMCRVEKVLSLWIDSSSLINMT